MRKRCQLIEEVKPDLVISIHQNSYHEEAIRGGQVFYYKTSVRGKKLAQILQERFDYVLGDANKRQAKANDNYYLLLHVKEPIIIAECGFLSNWEEAEKSGNKRVPGPAGLDLTYGDHGVSESGNRISVIGI